MRDPGELSTDDHDRDAAGMEYVYPVVSRRAGGVSVGVNLNPNKACNWRCVYCQVPGLVLGKAPRIDVARLERQLEAQLALAQDPAWLAGHAPEGARRLNDVAIAGDGEPTTSRQLPEVLRAIERVLERRGLCGALPVILITNGSLTHTAHVQSALEHLARLGGQVWFKLDSATEAGRLATNSERAGQERLRANLEHAARRCTTWLQTLVFRRAGADPSVEERAALLAFVRRALADGVPLAGVHLYGLARPSQQPEAGELEPLPRAWLESFGAELAALGLPVRVAP